MHSVVIKLCIQSNDILMCPGGLISGGNAEVSSFHEGSTVLLGLFCSAVLLRLAHYSH